MKQTSPWLYYSFIIILDCRLYWNNHKIRKEITIEVHKRSFSGRFWHIQVYSDIFRYNQAYLGIIQAHCRSCVNFTYSETWHIENESRIENKRHIQNHVIFRSLSYWEPETFRIEGYSEPWGFEYLRHIQNPVKHLQWRVIRK